MQSVGGARAELVLAHGSRDLEVARPPQSARADARRRWLLSQESPATREAYSRDLAAFFDWVDEFAAQLELEDVWGATRFHLEAYREFLRGEQTTRYHGTRHYAPSTIARKLTAISSFYGYCVDELPHLASRNPVARVKRPAVSADSSTGSLTLEQARRLLEAARAADARAGALVGMLLSTGMRISEALRVDTNDLGLERTQRIVWVRRKGGRRDKLPLGLEVAESVDRYQGSRQGALFLSSSGERLRRQPVDRILLELARSSGYVDEDGKPRVLTPHMLRHTAAGIAIDEGRSLLEVQRMLGHRDPKTTQRYIANRDLLERSAVHTVAAALERQPPCGVTPAVIVPNVSG